ncbi:MAG: SEC-C metal-binding domain-containing protein [Anaerovoracaceae bacterium]|nr:SEC-C metal-binding domain-containing protein [Bacillota bacterium]MDY2671507.1 SEC-C metal-binding domain-containing protein [Anaerovoracaceae bacterium]
MDEKLKSLCIKIGEDNVNLEDCLSKYTKVQLGRIAEIYGKKIHSSAKKAEMVETVRDTVKSDIIRYFDNEGKDFSAEVNKIVVEGGETVSPDDADRLQPLIDRGILFLRAKGDEAEAFLPADSSAIFDTGRLNRDKSEREQRMFEGEPVHKEADPDRDELENAVIIYAAAMAHMYGIYNVRMIKDVWDVNHKKKITPQECSSLIEKAGDSDGFYRRDNYIIDSSLTDPEDYCNILERIMPSDTYYYPTVNDVDRYRNGAVIEKNSHYWYLRNFIARMLDMPVPVLGDDEKLDSIMEKLAFAARCDNTLNEILVMLDGDGVKLETGEDQAKFLSLYTGFLYGQRLWATKGFKPEDMPASKMVVRNFKLPPYVNPKSEITPGRNEVCPCGSGKKFKKCCGKCID